MQKRILPIAITAITLISLFGWNCTKLDTTDIGGDQLPAVDNVYTFDTTLQINTTQQNIFSDSTYISKYDDFAAGSITNDPLFGTTTANIYMQLKPQFYPFYFGNAGDTVKNIPGVGVDSIILCLKYKGFWGDSTLPVGLRVVEVSDDKFRDSVAKENKTNISFTTGTSLSNTVLVNPLTLGNYIRYNYGRDSINNQIRIPITNTAWITTLFGRDSSSASGSTNAFYTDSAFRKLYNGIAVISTGSGNGLLYASLTDTSTKLEIYYRRKQVGATKTDSTYTSFTFNPSTLATNANAPVSNASNHIVRSRPARVSNPNADELFLQTSPGTFVNLNIPGLTGLSNRIIHRAEIIVEQIPTDPVLDEKLSAPNFLYLDLKDTGTANNWKPIYYDLNNTQTYDPDFKNGAFYLPVDNTGGVNINYSYFGGYKRTKADPLGNGQIKYYTFNVSRYVQQIVTDHTRSYDLRLYSPFNLSYPQYSSAYLPFGNNIAYGRVRIGSGTNQNYKLRLRIIYSKL